jgi:hypothetical protein
LVTTTWKAKSPPGSGSVSADVTDLTMLIAVGVSVRKTVTSFEVAETSWSSSSVAVTITVFAHADG